MKKQEVRDALFHYLQPHLDYNPEFRFSLTFAARIDRAEDVVNRFNQAPASAHKTTVTSMTQLSYFFPGEPEPKQYSVKTDDDIRKAVDKVGAVLRDKALPFLDAHRDLAALDRAMNGGDARFDTSDPTNRAVRALTVAKLAGNPRFEQLAASYQAEIRHFPEMSRQQLDQVIEYLRTLQT
ncbi:MAG: hypothetical protein E6J91_14130 [Deltaproteobacteria bacterium]|nr:MAG: hypothetical protein E6J91_14130 [Deltaproteobacteria bacterium]